MQKVKKKNRFTWLISLAVMLVLSGAVILATQQVDAAVYGRYRESQPVNFTVASTEAAALSDNAADYHVNAAEICYDDAGNAVAYAVETWEFGFNTEEPIVIRSTISADATLLAGIEVVSQDETEYYGDNISKESYTSRFTGRLFPILSSTDAGVGSKVDGWTGATYSSNAVIQAIDYAYRYVTEQMMG